MGFYGGFSKRIFLFPMPSTEIMARKTGIPGAKGGDPLEYSRLSGCFAHEGNGTWQGGRADDAYRPGSFG